jgi:hypothetical protein
MVVLLILKKVNIYNLTRKTSFSSSSVIQTRIDKPCDGGWTTIERRFGRDRVRRLDGDWMEPGRLLAGDWCATGRRLVGD